MQLQVIQKKIYELRGQKVMMDFDLAELYEVEVKRLKEAVRRNINRFPPDFMFELTKAEYDSLRTQIATLETGRGKHSKYIPFAFTEHGVTMLANVKKLFFIFSLFTFSFSLAFAQQDSLGFTNKAEAKNKMVNGLKEGKWMEYNVHFTFENINEHQYSVDSIIPSGDTNKYVHLINGSVRLPYYMYKLTVYKNGLIIGIQREYRSNGILSKEIPYHKGKINGIVKGYDENGKFEEEISYKNGLRNGIERGYYLGKLNRKNPYTEDTLNGTSIRYYPNGNIMSLTPYIYGKIRDTVKWYYESGKLKSEYPYSNGKANGVGKEYYESGKLKSEYPVKDDALNGVAIEYYESGLVMAKRTYADDTIVTKKNFDENGKELILSHFLRNTRTSEVLNLIQGTWVYVRDTTLQITITKKELSISEYNQQNIGDRFIWKGHGPYTVKYVDSTMKEQYDWLYIDGWAGYCLIAKKSGFIIQIYSISSNYMVIANDMILRRKDVHPH